jgi:hypothetical protein
MKFFLNHIEKTPLFFERISAYDLNYRLTETLNGTVPSDSEHMNMNMPMDSTLSGKQETPAKSQHFTYLFTSLGTVVATLSCIFYFQAKKSLTVIQKYLGLVK